MNRKIVIGGVVIVLLLLCALVAPSFVDWNKYKSQITAQLNNATGHDYTIGNLQLSVLPFPHIVISSLEVKAPVAQGGATLLMLDRAAVDVELLPLLGGQFHIGNVTLDKPVFTIAVDKNGAPDWMTPKLNTQQPAATAASATTQPAGKASAADKVVLKALHIKNGSIHFEDQRSGAVYAVSDIDLTVKGDGLFGPYKMDGGLVYGGEKIELDGKTGTFGKGADSMALSLKVNLPETKGAFEFSGVAGLKAPYELQGETSFKTDNLATVLKPFIKTMPGGLEKSVDLRGLMTASSEGFAMRNAHYSFGGAELDGDLSVANLKQSPIAVNINLSSSKPVDLGDLLPARPEAKAESESVAGTSAPANAPAAKLLPPTLSLPAPLSGHAALAFKSLTYHGQTMTDTGLSITFATQHFDGQFKSTLPGDAGVSGTFSLAYASLAKAKGNGITLANPSLSYRVQAGSEQPTVTLSGFLPPDQLEKMHALLAEKLSFDVKGTVTPAAAKADAGTLVVRSMPIAFSASYAPRGDNGRDAIAVIVSADQLNADALMPAQAAAPVAPPVPAAAPKAGAVPAPGKNAALSAVQSFSIPFNLDVGASVKTLTYGGNSYGNVSLRGKLQNETLRLTGAGFQDQAGNVLNVSGVIDNLRTLSGIDMTVNGKTPDANLLLKSLKVDAASIPANVGSASAVAEVKGQADKLGFTVNLQALSGSMEASGSLTDLLDHPSLGDLTVRLRHPDYSQLIRLFDPRFRASVDVAKNLDLFTSMQRDGNIYSFRNIKATVGPAGMSGEVKADMGGPVPSVTASLQFSALPLDKLLGTQATADTGTTEKIEAVSTKPNSGGHWSRTPINAAWMHKYNVDIKTTAGSASYGTWQFTNAALDFQLKDGILMLSKLDGGLYGGHIAMTGKMGAASAADPLDASASIKLENVSLESFVQSFSGSHLVKVQGTIGLDSDLTAKGASASELISALNGNGSMKGSDLQFEGFDLARISGALAQPSGSIGKNFSSILSAATSGGSTKFDTLDGAFTVAQGVITFDKMKLAGTDATVDTAGNVNLPLWTVDLESTITLPEPKNNPPPPLKVAFKGPLDNPSQTFGKGALENYFVQQYGAKLLDKLDKKGVLGSVLGVPQMGAGTATPAATTAAPSADGTTQPAAALAKVKTKDLFKGMLNQMIQQQGQK